MYLSVDLSGSFPTDTDNGAGLTVYAEKTYMQKKLNKIIEREDY